MSAPISSMVLDAGAFITGAKLDCFGANVTYWTTPRVMAELRDARTQSALAAFPFALSTRAVSDAALGAVSRFAAQTGDLAVLSATDLEIIALTYMLEVEANGTQFIRDAPVRVCAGGR